MWTQGSIWHRSWPTTANEWKLSKEIACNGTKNCSRWDLSKNWFTRSSGSSRNARRRRLSLRGPCRRCNRCFMLRGNRLSKSNRRLINSRSRAKKTDNWLLSYSKRIMLSNNMSTTKKMLNLRKYSLSLKQAYQSLLLELQFQVAPWKRT